MSGRACSVIRHAEKSATVCTQFHPVRKPRITCYSLGLAIRFYSNETTKRTKSAIRPPRRQDDYPNPRASYTSSPAPAPPPKTPNFTDAESATFLQTLFQPILPANQPIPAEVAARIVTHASWNKGRDGHNGRLIFLGRRVLNAYLMMFLSTTPRNCQTTSRDRHKSSKKANASSLLGELEFDLSRVSEPLMDTYILGEYVGAPWELQKIMRWTPVLPLSAAPTASTPTSAALRSSGLYKVRGVCVEAAIGGIYHHFGGTIAHRIFHSHVLPHLAKENLGFPAQLIGEVQRLQQILLGDSSQSIASPERESDERSSREDLRSEMTFMVSNANASKPRTSPALISRSSKSEPISFKL